MRFFFFLISCPQRPQSFWSALNDKTFSRSKTEIRDSWTSGSLVHSLKSTVKWLPRTEWAPITRARVRKKRGLLRLCKRHVRMSTTCASLLKKLGAFDSRYHCWQNKGLRVPNRIQRPPSHDVMALELLNRDCSSSSIPEFGKFVFSHFCFTSWKAFLCAFLIVRFLFCRVCCLPGHCHQVLSLGSLYLVPAIHLCQVKSVFYSLQMLGDHQHDQVMVCFNDFAVRNCDASESWKAKQPWIR